MPHESFDNLPAIYEAMIDWPKRLATEEPFYRGLFERCGAGRVLDVACGTGRHAAMFHAWGLAVEGADLSPAMIERCRRQFGESETLKWAVRGFDTPIPESGGFDVAICVGNSLALAPDRATVALAIGQMLAAIRPGGAIVVQVLNLASLPDGPCVWQKCLRAKLPQGECLIHKGIHRAGDRGFVELLVTPLDEPTPTLRSESISFLGLDTDTLAEAARRAGALNTEFFGDYRRQPYARDGSPDLIMIASK